MTTPWPSSSSPCALPYCGLPSICSPGGQGYMSDTIGSHEQYQQMQRRRALAGALFLRLPELQRRLSNGRSRPCATLLAALAVVAIALASINVASSTPAHAATPSAPVLSSPVSGSTLTSLGPDLRWQSSRGALISQIVVTPVDHGGGGSIDLCSGAIDAFEIPKPPEQYILLPNQLYSWKVRVTFQSSCPVLGRPTQEGDWSLWSDTWYFRTPDAGSDSIFPVGPTEASTQYSRTPVLIWGDRNPNAWYYEVQLSEDPDFGQGAAGPIASVYWELRHAGATTPPRSYAVRNTYPLSPGTWYFWRVRPRIEGVFDTPRKEWGATWSFFVAQNASLPAPITPTPTLVPRATSIATPSRVPTPTVTSTPSPTSTPVVIVQPSPLPAYAYTLKSCTNLPRRPVAGETAVVHAWLYSSEIPRPGAIVEMHMEFLSAPSPWFPTDRTDADGHTKLSVTIPAGGLQLSFVDIRAWGDKWYYWSVQFSPTSVCK